MSQSPETVETSVRWILNCWSSFWPAPDWCHAVPPAAGVKAGQRPPGGLGLDAGEDGAIVVAPGAGSLVRAGHATASVRCPSRCASS